ncbi:MAG: hypothetical protein FJ144_06275 [Deltaproteobacteria bacterium]|nr:hypothetical protein [Deltaproteobacteria bacterium]
MASIPSRPPEDDRGAGSIRTERVALWVGPSQDEGVSQEENASLASAALEKARRLVVFVIGGTVVSAGVAMLVLPGPAIVVIPAGLAILATEFAWARRLLDRVRAGIGLEPVGKPGDAPQREI